MSKVDRQAFIEVTERPERGERTFHERRIRHGVGQAAIKKWRKPAERTVEMIGPVSAHASGAVTLLRASGGSGSGNRG